MKKIGLYVATIVMLLGLGGCSGGEEEKPKQAQKPPVRVDAKILVSNFGQAPIVEVTALVDSITIKDVVANNGNCPMTAMRQSEFPHKLKYGQKATAGYTSRCNLIKVEVITDQGNWMREFSYIPKQYL